MAAKMIVTIALASSVPIRGSISVGATVCNVSPQMFVGSAIADAYQWSEFERPYRSVGVDFTPSLITFLLDKQKNDVIPEFLEGYPNFLPRVLTEKRGTSFLLSWYRDHLFVNHWAHGILLAKHVPDLMLGRKANAKDPGIINKINEAVDFQNFSNEQGRVGERGHFESFVWANALRIAQNQEMLIGSLFELFKLRKVRE